MENSNFDRNRSLSKVPDYKTYISVQQQTLSTFVHSFEFSEVFERHDISSGKKILYVLPIYNFKSKYKSKVNQTIKKTKKTYRFFLKSR